MLTMVEVDIEQRRWKDDSHSDLQRHKSSECQRFNHAHRRVRLPRMLTQILTGEGAVLHAAHDEMWADGRSMAPNSRQLESPQRNSSTTAKM